MVPLSMKCLVGIHTEKPNRCWKHTSGAWGDLEENPDLGYLCADGWEAMTGAVTTRMQSSGQAPLARGCREHPDGPWRWGDVT